MPLRCAKTSSSRRAAEAAGTRLLALSQVRGLAARFQIVEQAVERILRLRGCNSAVQLGAAEAVGTCEAKREFVGGKRGRGGGERMVDARCFGGSGCCRGKRPLWARRTGRQACPADGLPSGHILYRRTDGERQRQQSTRIDSPRAPQQRASLLLGSAPGRGGAAACCVSFARAHTRVARLLRPLGAGGGHESARHARERHARVEAPRDEAGVVEKGAVEKRGCPGVSQSRRSWSVSPAT